MKKILFVPLNTNHVLIFSDILKHIKSSWVLLSHDRIADSPAYHTEDLLKAKGIPYRHFPAILRRNEHDTIVEQLICFFKLKTLIKKVLVCERPDIIVMAVDNDPISYIFLKQARKLQIQTVIIQEGSVRPDLRHKIIGFRSAVKEILRMLGIRLSYIPHGSSNLYDIYCVSGMDFKEMLLKRGIPDSKIKITGQPKYDAFMIEAENHRACEKKANVLLFAAGFFIVADEQNIRFLLKLMAATKKIGIRLIIKLHPRSPNTKDEIRQIIGDENFTHCEIIKTGDETMDLLKQVYGVITIASTVVTEALIMDKEGILVDYIAKDTKLPFGGFNAVHHINSEDEIEPVIENAYKNKKLFSDKKNLLERNLFLLDGNSAERVAQVIEHM